VTRRLARCRRRRVALVTGALLLLGVAAATASVALDLDARLERAVDAFVGEVRSVRSAALAGEPWTIVTVEVEAWLRSAGAPVDDPEEELGSRPQVELAFLGGDAPGVARRTVAGMPSLAVGERVLLLSYGADARYASNLVGYDQGLFRLVDDVWTDVDGEALGFGPDGILTLGGDGAAADEEMLSALRARLEQVGVRP
jgi:hypothetical protein